jgi:hypothetical protein
MSSRRKMSLLLYRLLIRMSIRRDTSAWNSNFSAPSLRRSAKKAAERQRKSRQLRPAQAPIAAVRPRGSCV